MRHIFGGPNGLVPQLVALLRAYYILCVRGVLFARDPCIQYFPNPLVLNENGIPF